MTRSLERWDRMIGASALVTIVAGVLFVMTRTPARSLKTMLPHRGRHVWLRTERPRVRIGDPVIRSELTGSRQIGFVDRVEGERIRLLLDGDVDDDLVFQSHRTTGSLSEVTATLLPPDKRREVAELLGRWASENGRRVAGELVPILESALIRSLPLIRQGIAQSLSRHDAEVSAVGRKFQTDVVNDKLLPIARSRLIPIVRRHADEPARVIGQELWNRASLWSFAWRAVVDRSRLSDEDLVAAEWTRFVDEEAIPVLEDHRESIAETIRRIIVDAAADGEVREGLSDAAMTMVNDSATRQLAEVVLREAIAENQPLRRLWIDAVRSPEATRLIRQTASDIEPMIRQIGDTILGTAQGGISPGLTRVLRNQVLGRDRRWIVASPAGSGGETDRLYPASGGDVLPPVHLVGS